MSTFTDGDDESTARSATIHIPDSLLLEIIYRLPIKSIFQFKCLSKTWFSEISNPSFFQNYPCHHSNNGMPPWFIFSNFVNIYSRITIDIHVPRSDIVHEPFVISENPLFHYSFLNPPQNFRCIASCADLLLFLGPDRFYYVCSPVTKQCIQLPKLHNPTRLCQGIGLSSRVIDGVAHYKVVRLSCYVLRFVRMRILHADIFCSEIGKWRESKVVRIRRGSRGSRRFKSLFLKAISFSGIVHWLDHEDRRILAYNTETTLDECPCRLIDLPEGTEYGNRINRRMRCSVLLDVCQGQLRYFEFSDDRILDPGKMHGWSVWVLVGYEKGEWCLEHKGYKRDISSLDLWHSVHFSRRVIQPICFHPLNMDLMYLWCENHIFKFNLRSGLFEEAYHEFVEYFSDGPDRLYWWGVFSVVPSPLSTTIALPTYSDTEAKIGWVKKLLGSLFSCWLPN